MYSTYQDLLYLIDNLNPMTFDITYDWCISNGLKPKNAYTVAAWGRSFIKEYKCHNCKLISVGTDQHHTYEKK